jgi:hypothetical protein
MIYQRLKSPNCCAESIIRSPISSGTLKLRSLLLFCFWLCGNEGFNTATMKYLKHSAAQVTLSPHIIFTVIYSKVLSQ